ncbi:cAMP-binding domain of CRP or a regulatory subunit of cAMP-dependent protein kinases [Mesorhizobium albiziae]|uniref:cAMP-binding domain of CRP or a regulatory subunit of cAMP-dependent protein kinases n=2 Tax=Neomesorhizobium albiziae TaxID=335020 RepID=A0A1I4FCZ3_9HYPH|nr:cAMP-binding domain of CRP or a regulatory subunit of cAMP-dependent protein kinases [Mesorhizobium albiziae]
MPSSNLFIRKLEAFHPLSNEEKELLDRHSRPLREVPPKQDIIREGDKPACVHVIISGFACRYKLIKEGRRQIMAYMLPGDTCDFNVFILKRMDHGIATLSRCQVLELSPETVLEMTEHPAIARALWWANLVDESTMREWLVNIGQRPAEQRIGHLLCEILTRLEIVGLAKENTYTLPVTQTDLADTLGMTVVHANRMLTSLRIRDLIDIDARNLIIKDAERLKAFSGFNPNYLHLKGGS